MDSKSISICGGLNPVCRERFTELAFRLNREFEAGYLPALFKPEFGYQHPSGSVGRGGWQSPHAYGLAVQFLDQTTPANNLQGQNHSPHWDAFEEYVDRVDFLIHPQRRGFVVAAEWPELVAVLFGKEKLIL